MKNTTNDPLSRSRIEPKPSTWMSQPKKTRTFGCGCWTITGFIIIAAIGIFGFALAPIRTNIILIGLDFALEGSNVARSDTIIVTTIAPLKPYVGLLSIPRDLWVEIPGLGENRINTAHFFAESQYPGSGPNALTQTIYHNFGIQSKYYIRIHFDGFRELINTIDGVDISLDRPMAGYPAGVHHLNGNKALAFARNRSGSDDFFRMEQSQIILQSVFEKVFKPQYWKRIPSMMVAFYKVTDTNIPWWVWPRIILALLRTGPDGINKNIIDRSMITPYITSQGANVLLPNWSVINEYIIEFYR